MDITSRVQAQQELCRQTHRQLKIAIMTDASNLDAVNEIHAYNQRELAKLEFALLDAVCGKTGRSYNVSV